MAAWTGGPCAHKYSFTGLGSHGCPNRAMTSMESNMIRELNSSILPITVSVEECGSGRD